MAHKSTYKLLFARRRSGKTSYQKRLKLLKSKTVRLVVRRTNSTIRLQIVEYREDGDVTRCSASSTELKGFGWKGNCKNIPSSYLSGFLLGKRALKADIKEAMLDIGLQTSQHKGRLFAAVKGVLDAGLVVPVGEDALPDTNRLSGKHIEGYAQKLTAEQLQQRFAKAVKEGFDPKKTSEAFALTKTQIEKNPVQKK